MQVDANYATEQVSEQNLQTVTGGCSGCRIISDYAKAEAQAIMRNLKGLSRAERNGAVNQAEELFRRSNTASDTIGKVPREGQEYCDGFHALPKPKPL